MERFQSCRIMKDAIFFDLNGKYLYLDNYLVDYDIPIFYICKDSCNTKYAVMCIDSHNDEYIISKTCNKNIKAMLENQLTLRDFMLDSAEKWHTIYDSNLERDVSTLISDIEDSKLPKKEVFLDLYNKRVMDYLRIIEKEIQSEDVELQVQAFFKKCQFYESKTMEIEYYNLISDRNVNVIMTLSDYFFECLSDFLHFFKLSASKIRNKKNNVSEQFDETSYGKLSFVY